MVHTPTRRAWMAWPVVLGFALAIQTGPALARHGGHGGGATGMARGGTIGPRPAVVIARIAVAPAAPRIGYAPPLRPLQPAGATFTPYAAASGPPHPGAQVITLRRVATGYWPRAGWGGATQPAQPPAAPPSGPMPVVAMNPAPLSAGGVSGGGACPPPPAQIWIGGRLWIPDHQACDGSTVPGRWGGDSPLAGPHP